MLQGAELVLCAGRERHVCTAKSDCCCHHLTGVVRHCSPHGDGGRCLQAGGWQALIITNGRLLVARSGATKLHRKSSRGCQNGARAAIMSAASLQPVGLAAPRGGRGLCGGLCSGLPYLPSSLPACQPSCPRRQNGTWEPGPVHALPQSGPGRSGSKNCESRSLSPPTCKPWDMSA